MGIARLTSDLQTHLEHGYVSSNYIAGNGIHLRKLVIDGPSMVFHVHNRLAAYNLAKSSSPGFSDLPSYSQICQGVETFLSDLEKCGARILHIYFDGALPEAKRSVRLDRLEKSRAALEAYQISHPNPTFETSHAETRPVDVTEAIWQSDNSYLGYASGLSPPFIVPAVIEYLTKSRWSSSASIIPSEAESYCASLAGPESAAVLTNDSDLVLFDDLHHGGVVALLGSLSLKHGSNLECSCWRPGRICKKLGIPTLLHLAYERVRDASASYAVIVQRTKAAINTHTGPAFQTFAKQFRCSPGDVPTSSPPDLKDLDPRLAEVVCQFHEDTNSSTSTLQGPTEIYSTLPVLLEDPTRDSSWLYGRTFRRLAYSLLSRHYASTYHNLSKPQKSQPLIGIVTEFARKGRRISSDRVYTSSLTDQISSAATVLDHPVLKNKAINEFQNECSTSLNCTGGKWMLFALEYILYLRSGQRKVGYSAYTILQCLGLEDTSASKSQKRQNDKDRCMWRLIHLFANIHGVLYSLRMLKQIIDFIKSQAHSECLTLDKTIALENNAHALSAEIPSEMTGIGQALEGLPPLQHLILTPLEARKLFQSMNRTQLADTLRRLAEYDELKDALNSFVSHHLEVRKAESAIALPNKQSDEVEFESPKRKKKRKVGNETQKLSSGRSQKAGSGYHLSNSFSVLMEDE